MKIIIAKDYSEMSEIAANLLIETVQSNPKSVLGLATGSTPQGMYQKIVEAYNNGEVDFSQVETFNLDEYVGLPGSHPQSYQYFMDKNLFDFVNIPKENTHVPSGIAKDMESACSRYDKSIEKAGGIDVQILGIGNNGHIGFNEPAEQLQVGTHITDLTEDTIKANSRFFNTPEEVPVQAVTMGIATIMKARKIILLASGSSKAQIIEKLAEGTINTLIPASLLQVHSDVTVIVDREAGELISREANLMVMQ